MILRRETTFRLLLATLACGLGLALLAARATAATDWAAHAGADTVEVVTTDEDGSARETTIWLAVVDGQAFIRTGGSRWGDNVERDPKLTLRIDEVEIPLRAEFVTEAGLRERVSAAFREKYGFSDRLASILRGSNPRIMRLLPRGEGLGEAGS